MLLHMNTKLLARRFVVVLAAAVGALSVSLALADKDDHVEARELLRSGEIVPLSQVLDVVAQRVPGDVIEVELEREDDGTWEYEVKVLSSTGLVRKVKLNARTAVVIRIKDD
jgi:uncharacterized membrane protein YkoI